MGRTGWRPPGSRRAPVRPRPLMCVPAGRHMGEARRTEARPPEKSRPGRARYRRASRAREEMVGDRVLTTRPPVRGWTRARDDRPAHGRRPVLPLARADGRARVPGSALRLVPGDVLRLRRLLPGTAVLRRELPRAGLAARAAHGQSAPPADAGRTARSPGSHAPVPSAAPHERDGYGSPKTCVPGSLVAAERSGDRHDGGPRDGRRRRPR
jgi:hypothetical protein